MSKADGAHPYIQPNPVVSERWRSRWNIEYEPRWRKIGIGYFPREASAAEPALPPCRETILALERKINGGAQLSVLKET